MEQNCLTQDREKSWVFVKAAIKRREFQEEIIASSFQDDQIVCQLVGQLVGCLVSWLVGLPVGCLVYQLVGQLVG